MNIRKIKALETQKKLLETSKELIIRKGYENVSISEICQTCNVSKGSFYTYFSSKTEIVLQILSDINDHMFNRLEDNIDQSATAQLMEYITVYMEEIRNQGVVFSRIFLGVIIQKQLPNDSLHANLHEERVCRIIEQGKKNGEFRLDLSAISMHEHLAMYLFGLMMHWCAADGSYDIVEAGRNAATEFLTIFNP